MSNKTSFLATIGKDIKSVFAWLTSSKGQLVLGTVEATVASVFPPADGIIAIFNAGLTEAIKIESLAVAAGEQSSGSAKLSDLVSTLTPQILAFAKSNGYPIPGAIEIQNVANGIVAVLNALTATSSTASVSTNPQ